MKLFKRGFGDGGTAKKTLAKDELDLHPDAHEEGGLSCNDDAALSEMRAAVSSWVASMGRKLLSGSLNLINTPFPVTVFEPRSYLEKLADVWVYPRFLSMAAEATDPMERMKCTVAWFMAGLHHGFEKWKKPFNPILGETWQASQADGSSIFMEQICHHPPISAFHIEGPGGKYRFRGMSQPNVSLMLKYYGFKTVAKGFRYVEFNDGSRIDIHYPSYVVRGIVRSPRPRAEVEGYASFTYQQAGLKAVIGFGAVKGSKSALLQRSDAISGGIYAIGNGPAGSVSYSGTSTATAPGSGQPSPKPHIALSSATSASAPDLLIVTAPSTTACHHDDDAEFESASETDYDTPLDGSPGSQPRSGENKVTFDSEFADKLLSGDVEDIGPTPPASSGKSIFSSFSKLGLSRGIRLSVGSNSGSTEVEETEARLGAPICRLEGSWVSHLSFDGEKFWVLKNETQQAWQPAVDALLSDSRYRLDLMTVQAGNLVQAQVMKERMEHRQRQDKKLREEGSGRKH